MRCDVVAVLCLLILIGVLMVALWTLTAASGDAMRHGDEKAREYYGGEDNGKNHGG